MREVIQWLTKGFARPENVRFRQGSLAPAALREKVSAEEGSRRKLHHQPAIPTVRNLRSIDPSNGMTAEGQLLTVRQRARRPIGKIAQRHHGADLAADRHGLR